MKPTREVKVKRLRCPWCGAAKGRGVGPRVTKTRELPDGDTRQNSKCRTCGNTFHVLIKDDFVHNVDTRPGSI